MGIYNQLKDKFIMKDAYKDWENYRKALTDLILNNSDMDLSFNKSRDLNETKSIAIIGAGRCNDIDLVRLAEIFDEITLIDIDATALEECLSLQEENVKKKIKTEIISINGLYENDMEAFCDELLNFVRKAGRELNEKLYEKFLDEMLEGLNKKIVAGLDMLQERFSNKSYDVVVCNGVYSQLLSMYSFLIRSVSQSVSDELKLDVSGINRSIEIKLSKINTMSVPAINKELIAVAKKKILFGNEFPEKSRVEGAAECIDDIRKNYMPDEIMLKWDFNLKENIFYNILIQIVKK